MSSPQLKAIKKNNKPKFIGRLFEKLTNKICIDQEWYDLKKLWANIYIPGRFLRIILIYDLYVGNKLRPN